MGYFSVKSVGTYASVCDGEAGEEGTRDICGLGDILSCNTCKGRMFAHEIQCGVSLQLKYEVWKNSGQPGRRNLA